MKAITAVLCSAVLCLGSLGNFPLNAAYRMNAAAADQTGEAEERIYRTSVEVTAQDNASWKFIAILNAYSNGHIKIDVQCIKSTNANCNIIGNIQFDDSMVASIGEKGYAGTSYFNNNKFPSSKYTESFSDTSIFYTAFYSEGSDSLSGSTLMTFDLYVKEKYLHTNQTIWFFGLNIEIPFGNPPVDKDSMIAQLQAELDKYKNGTGADEELATKVQELEKQNQELKDDNEALKRTINILSKAKFCDVNQDDVVDVSDAQLVLMYYTESIAGLTKGDPIEIWYAKRNTIDTITG